MRFSFSPMSSAHATTLNEQVRAFWEAHPCGTAAPIVGDTPARSREWFDRIEEHRYSVEPFIHAVAQFTRSHGRKLLEVGVGAGTDHLQWARAGAQCYGVDLTDAAIEITRAHLAAYGFQSQLQRVDAETLPFADGEFDVVYSWGVIHHSEHPERIIGEIHRVLRAGGTFIGMMYGRHSVAAMKRWIQRGLLAGKPWLTLRNVLWHDLESPGTKAYTVRELHALFATFSSFTATPILTNWDKQWWPRWFAELLPERWGWFITLRGVK